MTIVEFVTIDVDIENFMFNVDIEIFNIDVDIENINHCHMKTQER